MHMYREQIQTDFNSYHIKAINGFPEVFGFTDIIYKAG